MAGKPLKPLPPESYRALEAAYMAGKARLKIKADTQVTKLLGLSFSMMYHQRRRTKWRGLTVNQLLDLADVLMFTDDEILRIFGRGKQRDEH